MVSRGLMGGGEVTTQTKQNKNKKAFPNLSRKGNLKLIFFFFFRLKSEKDNW